MTHSAIQEGSIPVDIHRILVPTDFSADAEHIRTPDSLEKKMDIRSAYGESRLRAAYL